MSKVDDGLLLERILPDEYKDDIEPLINSIDLQLIFEDKRDDAANDGDADHPHRVYEPHPADARKHCDDHHHVEMAEGATSLGVSIDFIVFLDNETVDKDTNEEFIDAAVFVEVGG